MIPETLTHYWLRERRRGAIPTPVWVARGNQNQPLAWAPDYNAALVLAGPEVTHLERVFPVVRITQTGDGALHVHDPIGGATHGPFQSFARVHHLAYLMAGPHARLELDPSTRY